MLQICLYVCLSWTGTIVCFWDSWSFTNFYVCCAWAQLASYTQQWTQRRLQRLLRPQGRTQRLCLQHVRVAQMKPEVTQARLLLWSTHTSELLYILAVMKDTEMFNILVGCSRTQFLDMLGSHSINALTFPLYVLHAGFARPSMWNILLVIYLFNCCCSIKTYIHYGLTLYKTALRLCSICDGRTSVQKKLILHVL